MHKLNTAEFIEKSIEIHGNKYNYSKVNYINNKTKLIIICKTHGEFLQRACNHMRGNGCPFCKEHKPRRILTNNEFINRAREIHGNRYDYSKVTYIGTYIKVKIICSIHGIFAQEPHLHS